MGKLVVVSRDRVGEAAVKLITPETGKLFAVAPVRRDGPPAAEKVTDSSRYFALRIENDKGAWRALALGVVAAGPHASARTAPRGAVLTRHPLAPHCRPLLARARPCRAARVYRHRLQQPQRRV